MTMTSLIIFGLVSFWIVYMCWIGYLYNVWREGNKAAKPAQHEVIKVLQGKTAKFFNDFYPLKTDMCMNVLSEHIEINGVKYSYRIFLILDMDNDKEINNIEIKLKRE